MAVAEGHIQKVSEGDRSKEEEEKEKLPRFVRNGRQASAIWRRMRGELVVWFIRDLLRVLF